VGDAPVAAAQGLTDRRELALIAVERTRMPMVVTDPRQADNPIVLANQAFLNLSGYTVEEVLGKNCRFLQGERTSPTAVAQIREAAAEERPAIIELLNYRKDGTTFWNQLLLSPIHDEEGELIYFFASQADVSERRKSEELQAAEQVLRQEVDHRSMNALALVQGIVRLSRSEDPKQYAASVERRVQALARAHTILASQGWKPVPLDRLIHLQIEPHDRGRVKLDGPQIEVSIEVVQALALIIHELAADTATQGALSHPNGSVAVRWAEDEARTQIHLHWQEAGGPVSPPAAAPRVGSSLIDRVLKRQLRGTIERSWATDGFKAELVIPLGAPSGATRSSSL
jgi:PAS domain S-box-containing protein